MPSLAVATLQLLTGLTITIGVLCYGIGLFIYNLDLARFGIAEFGAFRTRYVAVGVLFAFFAVSPIAVGLASRVLEADANPAGRPQSLKQALTELRPLAGKVVLQSLGGGAVGTMLSLAALASAFDIGRAVDLYIVWDLFLWGSLAAGFGVATKIAWRSAQLLADRERRGVESANTDYVSRMYPLVWLVAVALAGATVVSYAQNVYPNIPQGLGGGRPELVRVFPQASVTEDVGRMLDAKRTQWVVMLLDETDATYLFGVPDADHRVATVASVPRTSIGGLVRIEVRRP